MVTFFEQEWNMINFKWSIDNILCLEGTTGTVEVIESVDQERDLAGLKSYFGVITSRLQINSLVVEEIIPKEGEEK